MSADSTTRLPHPRLPDGLGVFRLILDHFVITIHNISMRFSWVWDVGSLEWIDMEVTMTTEIVKLDSALSGAEIEKQPDIELPQILIVEDEKELQTFLTYAMGSINYKAVFAKSVVEAIDKLKKQKFSLVFADHYLEGAPTGLDLWKICQKKWSTTPFLLTSAMGTQRYLKLTAGLRKPPLFLPKPFKFSECRSLIKTLILGGPNGVN